MSRAEKSCFGLGFGKCGGVGSTAGKVAISYTQDFLYELEHHLCVLSPPLYCLAQSCGFSEPWAWPNQAPPPSNITWPHLWNSGFRMLQAWQPSFWLIPEAIYSRCRIQFFLLHASPFSFLAVSPDLWPGIWAHKRIPFISAIFALVISNGSGGN